MRGEVETAFVGNISERFSCKMEQKNRTVSGRRNGVQRTFLSLLLLGEIKACLYTDVNDPVKQKNMMIPEREAWCWSDSLE